MENAEEWTEIGMTSIPSATQKRTPVRDYCKICPKRPADQCWQCAGNRRVFTNKQVREEIHKKKNSSDSGRLQNFGDFTLEVGDKWKRWVTRMVVLCTE